MTICLLTEVKWQWAMLVFGWVTVSVRVQLWDVSKLELCPPHWGVDRLFFLFLASAIRHAWFPVISSKCIYPMLTKFGMGVYWVNSLHVIAFGEDSSIANRVIAT